MAANKKKKEDLSKNDAEAVIDICAGFIKQLLPFAVKLKNKMEAKAKSESKPKRKPVIKKKKSVVKKKAIVFHHEPPAETEVIKTV